MHFHTYLSKKYSLTNLYKMDTNKRIFHFNQNIHSHIKNSLILGFPFDYKIKEKVSNINYEEYKGEGMFLYIILGIFFNWVHILSGKAHH
jgi:hypothetical protein